MERFLAQNIEMEKNLSRAAHKHIALLSLLDTRDFRERISVKDSLLCILHSLESTRYMREWATERPEEVELFMIDD